ncbi:DUF3048 domain-containing protein [Gorillibacterium massiliense]|uniref:DUF3048 domain-containing protein n=1 Tax=Gorillibacterium massiliense TaxID=1280390 RepID=UPI0004B7DA9C|nr:DUF3048 domain-containing protein [Gorillibacterium massiliense]
MKRKKRFLLIICCTVLSTTVIGCNAKKSPPQPTTTVTATPAETAASTPAPTAETVNPYTFPLTGLGSMTELNTRPFLVTVENSPAARPQSGLDKADIVYEVLAEGEITRFLAIFQSQQPTIIGPVRSMRPYFVEIGHGLDAILVHAGWSQDAMNMMVKLGVAHLDELYGDGASYWRSKERKAPHNLYTSFEKATEGAARRKFRTTWTNPQLLFAQKDLKVEGLPAKRVDIPYLLGYKVAYNYDEATGLYMREMDGKPHLDKETGVQLFANNLFIIETKHRVLDNAGRQSVDVQGPGDGYLLQQGKVQTIKWEMKNGAIRAYKDGKELPLLPGKTWVQIVPLGTKTAFQ